MALRAKGKPIDSKLHKQTADVVLPPERGVGAIVVARSPPMPCRGPMLCQRALLQRDDAVELSDLGGRRPGSRRPVASPAQRHVGSSAARA